jgi:hypothetical protein
MPDASKRLALLGVVAGLAVAVAGTVVRRRRRPRDRDVPPAGRTISGAPSEPQTYTCTCGREYRTSGTGRHRVYWPAGAPDDDPVLGDACPECGTPLPVEPTGAAA